MIAVFLVIRLRNALGRRDRPDNSLRNDAEYKNEASDNVIDIASGNQTPSTVSEKSKKIDENNNGEPNLALQSYQKALDNLIRLDPLFDVENFIVGSRVAFEMVLKAFSSGDIDTLKNLLNSDVFTNFQKAIQDREKANETLIDTLVGIKNSEIIEMSIDETVVNITVKFITDQITVVKNKDGEIISGDPKAVISVTDFWTFSRDVKNNNPNWSLVATRSLE
jgi:predicted lipid-binding transport protein (Tim44 family)